MIKCYDKSRHKLSYINNFKINRLTSIGTDELVIEFNNIDSYYYAEEMLNEINTAINVEGKSKLESVCDFYILKEDKTLVELVNCILSEANYDENNNCSVTFLVDYYKYHLYESDMMYDIICEERNIKLNQLLD